MDEPLIFAACAPGLEPVLTRELEGLGLTASPVAGGVEARGEDALAVACLGSRVADAVALRIYAGESAGLDRAIADARRRFGARAPLAIRRQGAQATLSLDAVGSPLFRRGWRARIGAAPLRESLAAGLLLAAGFDGERPFLDPMCGSGTIALEAAAIAARRAPGRDRRFAFESWPGHDARRTASVRARLAALERPPPAPIHASDRNAGVLRLAQKNAAASGLAPHLRFSRCDAAQAELPSAAGLIVTNPPYGLRLAEEVETAWRALGVLLARAQRWQATVLAPATPLERAIARGASSALRIRNGGLSCRMLCFPAQR